TRSCADTSVTEGRRSPRLGRASPSSRSLKRSTQAQSCKKTVSRQGRGWGRRGTYIDRGKGARRADSRVESPQAPQGTLIVPLPPSFYCPNNVIVLLTGVDILQVQPFVVRPILHVESPARHLVDISTIDRLLDTHDFVKASFRKFPARVTFVVLQLGKRFEQFQSVPGAREDLLALHQDSIVVHQTLRLSHKESTSSGPNRARDEKPLLPSGNLFQTSRG